VAPLLPDSILDVEVDYFGNERGVLWHLSQSELATHVRSISLCGRFAAHSEIHYHLTDQRIEKVTITNCVLSRLVRSPHFVQLNPS
jgi:hypothetical protein